MSKLLKTLIITLLSCALVFSITACNNGNDDQNDATVTGEFVYKLYTDEEDDHKYYAVTGYTVTSEDAVKMATGDFSSFTSEQREITIPSTHGEGEKEYPVEEIAPAAFADQVILKKVTVNSNIKKIGEGAFSGCTNLEELTLPFVGKTADSHNSERVFGYLFGSGSTGDGNVQITAKIHKEEEEAGTTFSVPASLKTVTVHSNKIPECAFYGMAMLQSVEFPNATSIGAYAFQGCSLLTQANLGNVTEIYDGAFQLCTSLQKAVFAEGLTFVGEYAFSGCSRLGLNYATNDKDTITVKLPSTVNYLGKYAFSNCLELKYVDISACSALETVYEGTFSSCESLEEVKVHGNTFFRAGTFSKSPKLDESKIIGAGANKFEAGAFGTIE